MTTDPILALESTLALSDGAALDAICAIVNTTDSGADVVQAVSELVIATGRPVVDELPVVESRVQCDRHGLPTAVVDIDGVEVVQLRITRERAVHIRLTRPADPTLRFTVEHDDGVETPTEPAGP